MLGSIIGDIAGSRFEGKEHNKERDYNERIQILDRNIPLFTDECEFTDDTILTTAIADAIINHRDYKEVLREYGLKYVNKKNKVWGNAFGKGFIKWLHSENDGKSIGNGSAMRVSPIGFYYSSVDEVLENAKLSTIPSHNSEEAIKGAQAVALSIYLAKQKLAKNEIKRLIEGIFKYDLNLDLSDLQHNYTFHSTCQESVPQAIYSFLVADSFEDGIRKSLSIGGDTDTIACMTGSILEAYYEIPLVLKINAIKYLDQNIRNITHQFYSGEKTKLKTFQ
jgi:ADP-ribosylglycohydrolase